MADDEAATGGDGTFAPSAIHLLRTTTTLNLAHNQMADQKASMLMGATFVVFTLTLGQASRGHAPLALLVLGAFAFVSALVAVAVVMPKMRGSRALAEQPNPMFFGAIARYERDDYVATMMQALASEQEIHRIMLCHIWQTGQALAARKYRLLTIAYRIFLAGLVVSALLFVGQMAGMWF